MRPLIFRLCITNPILRSLHLLQPRRIIPGQKIHVSILHANAYNPRASPGGGFDIPMVHPEPDAELGSQIWETGLFDDTAAQQLMTNLGGPQGVAPIFLDRLLFMLRFGTISFFFSLLDRYATSTLEEGRQCVRNVPGWEKGFSTVLENRDCEPFVRLGTTIAYYEGEFSISGTGLCRIKSFLCCSLRS